MVILILARALIASKILFSDLFRFFFFSLLIRVGSLGEIEMAPGATASLSFGETEPRSSGSGGANRGPMVPWGTAFQIPARQRR